MCGIIGYSGYRDAPAILLEGLKRLEYRGYDSAGIAVIAGDQIERRRSPGKLANLEKILLASPPHGQIGIGHTRWATHGKPSEANAHPHTNESNDIVVVHNGIVENYLELKRGLQERGHCFASETDTEALPHLIEEAMDAGCGLAEAVRQVLHQIRGGHAIVAMSLREPETIVAARLGNAGGMVIGIGQDEMFVASDLPAILEYTRSMIFLESGEVAEVHPDGVICTDLDGTILQKQPRRISWDPLSAARGGYKHFMLKEIHEQSRAIADTIAGRIPRDPARVDLQDVRMTPEQVARLHKVVIVACGTAWHAGLVAKFMIEELTRLPVEVDYASEFRYRDPLVDDRTLLIAVTQSGETVDTLVSMHEASERGARVLGVVNVVGSQASQIADDVVYTHAGPEIGVASTKAFTCQLSALYLLAVWLGHMRGTLSSERVAALLDDLARLPSAVDRLLAEAGSNEGRALYEQMASRYHTCRDFLYLGRNIQYPIALEGALKLKEISYIHAEGYPAGEMKHGPIALIEPDMPVVAICLQDAVYEKMLSNIEQVQARDGVIVAIATEGDEIVPQKAVHTLFVPPVSPLLAPIIATIPLQLLAYSIAVRRGCDVDQPRNLAKSVTVE